MPNAQPRRCSWVNVDQPVMLEYHDREWGVPAHDDRTHFEFLILRPRSGTQLDGRPQQARRLPSRFQ